MRHLEAPLFFFVRGGCADLKVTFSDGTIDADSRSAPFEKEIS